MPRRTRPAGQDRAERVVAGLFEHPPVSEAELSQRLASASAARARYRLLQRLRGGALSEAQVPLLVHAFSCLGLGEEGEALATIVRGGADPHRRAAALQILARADPSSLEAQLGALAPDDADAVIEHWLSDLLGEAATSPSAGESIARALEAAAPARRRALLARLEACRARVGTAAAAAYGVALARPSLAPLHGHMRDAVARERAGPATLGEGEGYLGSCDGQGTFLVVGASENREDGSLNVAQVCVRAGGELCDGFLSPRCSREELRQRLSEITRATGIEFVRVALGVAAAIARDARPARGELSPDARAALALFERVAEPRADDGQADAGLALVEASLEPLRGLLCRPPYQHSWFFDRGDLDGSGVTLPEPGDRLDDWVARAAPRLDRPAIRERLAAMARHMARWHRLGGEPRAAALCESAAREVETRCSESALLRAMLERSVVPAGEARLAEAGHDPVLLRQHLKRVFFADVTEPRGRDLARLDFTEAAFRVLEEACLSIPSERRPREDHRAAAAFAIGRAFADFLLSGARGPIEQVIAPVERALHGLCHLDREECRRAVERVLPSLGAFIESHCTRCPVACLDRPDARLADAFFAAAHPAAGDHE